MKLIIKWKYLSNDSSYFSQTINIHKTVSVNPQFCVGAQIVNIYTACVANYNFEISNNIFELGYRFFNAHEFNNSGFSKLCFISELVEVLAEITFTKIKKECNALYAKKKNGSNENVEFFGCYCKNEEDFQNVLDRYLESYNNLLCNYVDCLKLRIINSDFYRKLVEILNRYNNGDSKLLKDYLAKNEGRCFATFIESETKKKHIAFSGFFDCKEEKILKWLNVGVNRSFLALLNSISKYFDANLIETQLQIAEYSCKRHFNSHIKYTLENIIDNGFSKDMKKHFSCAERKIFAHFDNKTPDGELFVKFEMCCKCCKGYRYQMKSGARIWVYDGLEI